MTVFQIHISIKKKNAYLHFKCIWMNAFLTHIVTKQILISILNTNVLCEMQMSYLVHNIIKSPNPNKFII